MPKLRLMAVSDFRDYTDDNNVGKARTPCAPSPVNPRVRRAAAVAPKRRYGAPRRRKDCAPYQFCIIVCDLDNPSFLQQFKSKR
jgi:hypothetical protein